MNLAGKRVLVTGGARRIGAAIVRMLAAAGAEVVIHANRSRQEAEALAAALPGRGHTVTVCDLADPAAVKAWLNTLPELDALVNNASAYRLSPPGTPLSEPEKTIYREVNFEAPLQLIQHCSEQKKSGAVVNLLDAAALSPLGAPPAEKLAADPYLASKQALTLATLELGKVLAPAWRVNGIAPGPVLPPEGVPNGGMVKILAKVPLARPVALDDLVSAVRFLLENDSLTGAVLPVDGGMHL